MASPYVSNAGSFLISVVFDLFIYAVMLRLLLQLVRADFYNPISQAIVRLTNPLLRPLRRHVPGYKGIDLPSVLLLLVLEGVKITLIAWVNGASPGLGTILALAPVELLQTAIHVFVAALLIQFVLSWVAPGAYNPVSQITYSLTAPLLRPLRRLIPPLGGLDFTLLVALVALQLAVFLIVHPLRDLALGL
ncbi:MAG: YggT family protein [Gammaproteobacteria bacterium]